MLLYLNFTFAFVIKLIQMNDEQIKTEIKKLEAAKAISSNKAVVKSIDDKIKSLDKPVLK